jgi:IstB-like ATP binding protein
VLLGDSGTGKTHLLIGLGIAACEQARRVRYATCAQLVNELVEAADERRPARLVARYGGLDLLLIDEVGYVQLDTRGAELLFQVLTEREEKSSIGLASNLPLSEWGGIIADARLVAAVIIRVTLTPTSSRRAPSPTATAPAHPATKPPRLKRPHPPPRPGRVRGSQRVGHRLLVVRPVRHSGKAYSHSDR